MNLLSAKFLFSRGIFTFKVFTSKKITHVGQAVLIVISCRVTQRAKENKKPGAHTKLDEKTKIRIGKYLSENGHHLQQDNDPKIYSK